MMPYSPLKANWCFGGTYSSIFRLKNNPSKKLAWSRQKASSFFVLPKRQSTISKLHCVIPKKIELFLTTAVGTSDPIIKHLLCMAICNHTFALRSRNSEIFSTRCSICHAYIENSLKIFIHRSVHKCLQLELETIVIYISCHATILVRFLKIW
jgi:hypothetical protein